MSKVTLKVIMSIVICSFLITLLLSSVAITKTKEVLNAEVEKELYYAAQKYANQFSQEFEKHEKVTDLISIMVEDSFTASEYRGNRGLFETKNAKLSGIMKKVMEDNPEIKSLYFTFNPELSGENDETWYIRNESDRVIYMEADNTIENWLVDGDEESEYYFSAIRNGKNWSGVEYDMYLDNYALTYSRACYDKNGEFIGVMGTDFFVEDIFNDVKHIQLEEGGYSFLMDEEYNYLVGSKPKEYFMELKDSKVISQNKDGSGVYDENKSQKINKDNLKSISYSIVDGERYIATYGETSNQWKIALVQSESSLMTPIKYMKQMLYTMAGLTLIGVIVYAFYFSNRSVSPIVKESEQKDIVLMHQSRQAKLGEMVGNIAHQWKQPLNVMNIALSNLWDDYKNGLLDEENLKKQIGDMRLYIKSMSTTVDDFADFLKPSRKKEAFDPCEAIEISLGLMAESLRINRISVKFEKQDNLSMYGYKNEFCQGIFNVLNNARDSIIQSNPEKREIFISVETRDENKKSDIYIEIINKGALIPDEIMPQLFTPYCTTKEDIGGTGIGLYLTKEIIESHMNGEITLKNLEDGVCCLIKIPGGIEG